MLRQQRKINEIEILRGISILAVVFIHVSSYPVTELSTSSTVYPIYLVFNRLAQFAVPSFIFISAAVITYNSIDEEIYSWRKFYFRRFKQVVIPYLLWTVFYLAYRFWADRSLGFSNLTNWENWLLFGKSFYHLYYLPVIIELYLYIPLLVELQKKFRLSFSYWLGLSIIGQLLFNSLLFGPLKPVISFPAATIFRYLPLAFLGIWLGSSYKDWIYFWQRYRWVLVPITLAAGLLYIEQTLGFKLISGMADGVWYVYVTGVSLLLFQFAQKLDVIGKRFSTYLSVLGSHSFGIYLIHPLVLSVWEHFISTGNPVFYHIVFILEYTVVFLVSLLITKLLHYIPFGRWLLGNR